MTASKWQSRYAAIHQSALAEGFDIANFVHRAEIGDPHRQHLGVAFNALVPKAKVASRIEDVANPLMRGGWAPPTELCEAPAIARRKVLSDILAHDGDPASQMAVLVAAFVHSHVTNENRRRFCWPLDVSSALVEEAVEHLSSIGTDMVLPVKGTYALIGTAHMCRSAPEPYCDSVEKLDRSVGRHVAMSFRDSMILAISIKAGGTAAALRPKADTRSLLALSKEDLQKLYHEQGLDGICSIYGMKPQDVTMACRRRGVIVTRAA